MIVFFIALTLSPWIAQSKMTITEHCDIPGHSLRTTKTKDQTACRELCQNEPDCQAFVFISGWGRCDLKKLAAKQFKIQIASGAILTKEGRRIMVSKGLGWDNMGKDYRQAKKASTISACESECLGDQRCQAYAFVQGYGLCWLKKKNGKKVRKTFYCGTKSSP